MGVYTRSMNLQFSKLDVPPTRLRASGTRTELELRELRGY